MARILVPLPRRDYDPSEAAVPWLYLSRRGHDFLFATPDGRPAQTDPRMLQGHGLGPFKRMLMADERARDAHQHMVGSPAFRKPLRWDALGTLEFDALLLPGGHAQGMREYLESAQLQALVAHTMAQEKPVAAVCHGVVLAARAKAASGRSALHGRRVTALLARQELLAWLVTAPWLGRYYRTYPQTVQAEVTAALASSRDFQVGPAPLRRDAPNQEEIGFVVRDGNLVTARWPGDVNRMAMEFGKML